MKIPQREKRKGRGQIKAVLCVCSLKTPWRATKRLDPSCLEPSLGTHTFRFLWNSHFSNFTEIISRTTSSCPDSSPLHAFQALHVSHASSAPPPQFSFGHVQTNAFRTQIFISKPRSEEEMKHLATLACNTAEQAINVASRQPLNQMFWV